MGEADVHFDQSARTKAGIVTALLGWRGGPLDVDVGERMLPVWMSITSAWLKASRIVSPPFRGHPAPADRLSVFVIPGESATIDGTQASSVAKKQPISAPFLLDASGSKEGT